MTSENVREQLALGYIKARMGLNEGRIEDLFESEAENESRGALAAIVFYGACVRESMSRGVDDPIQAHTFATIALEFFEENDFESVIHYLVGKPLSSRVMDMVEFYKANFQSDMANMLSMVDNLKIEMRFESGDDNLDLDED